MTDRVEGHCTGINHPAFGASDFVNDKLLLAAECAKRRTALTIDEHQSMRLEVDFLQQSLIANVELRHKRHLFPDKSVHIDDGGAPLIAPQAAPTTGGFGFSSATSVGTPLIPVNQKHRITKPQRFPSDNCSLQRPGQADTQAFFVHTRRLDRAIGGHR